MGKINLIFKCEVTYDKMCESSSRSSQMFYKAKLSILMKTGIRDGLLSESEAYNLCNFGKTM